MDRMQEMIWLLPTIMIFRFKFESIRRDSATAQGCSEICCRRLTDRMNHYNDLNERRRNGYALEVSEWYIVSYRGFTIIQSQGSSRPPSKTNVWNRCYFNMEFSWALAKGIQRPRIDQLMQIILQILFCKKTGWHAGEAGAKHLEFRLRNIE